MYPFSKTREIDIESRFLCILRSSDKRSRSAAGPFVLQRLSWTGIFIDSKRYLLMMMNRQSTNPKNYSDRLMVWHKRLSSVAVLYRYTLRNTEARKYDMNRPPSWPIYLNVCLYLKISMPPSARSADSLRQILILVLFSVALSTIVYQQRWTACMTGVSYALDMSQIQLSLHWRIVISPRSVYQSTTNHDTAILNQNIYNFIHYAREVLLIPFSIESVWGGWIDAWTYEPLSKWKWREIRCQYV